MAKYVVGKGIDDYIRKLGNLYRYAPKACGYGVFEGAKIIADAVDAAVAALPINDSNDYNAEDHRVSGVTAVQKAGLRSSSQGGGLGIAKMKNDGGYYNVSVGFHGYNAQKTQKYPNGQPNAMIARSVNSGSYFRTKNPFFDRAIRKSRKQAEEAMAKAVDDYINNIMK